MLLVSAAFNESTNKPDSPSEIVVPLASVIPELLIVTSVETTSFVDVLYTVTLPPVALLARIGSMYRPDSLGFKLLPEALIAILYAACES